MSLSPIALLVRTEASRGDVRLPLHISDLYKFIVGYGALTEHMTLSVVVDMIILESRQVYNYKSYCLRDSKLDF